ncbi:hypothetical protein F7725_019472, partial [Dissostichus mawsoni]
MVSFTRMLVLITLSFTVVPPPRQERDPHLSHLCLTLQAYVSVGVFPNDISDHCTIACVRSTKLPKAKGLIVLRRSFKHFSEQAFLHDLAE